LRHYWPKKRRNLPQIARKARINTNEERKRLGRARAKRRQPAVKTGNPAKKGAPLVFTLNTA
jgi:hypothetical protein